jgi:hypothetical protein
MALPKPLTVRPKFSLLTIQRTTAYSTMR